MSEVRSVLLGELGRRLRQVRRAAGLTGAELATRADVLDRLTTALDLTIEDRINLRDLLGRASEELARRRGQTRGMAVLLSIVERERGATTVRSFQNAMIPALVQTAEYARQVFVGTRWLDEAETARATAIHVERQSVLYQPNREFVFILTEGALRTWPGEPQVMLAQLDRLLVLATLTSVRLGVLPWRSGTDFPLHGFTMYDEGPVSIETFTSEVVVADREEITAYSDLFGGYEAAALYGVEAKTFIEQVATDFRSSIVAS
jgi:transcriptional regulator with XRE-family HTH domain